jgi:hypothetical protein
MTVIASLLEAVSLVRDRHPALKGLKVSGAREHAQRRAQRARSLPVVIPAMVATGRAYRMAGRPLPAND